MTLKVSINRRFIIFVQIRLFSVFIWVGKTRSMQKQLLKSSFSLLNIDRVKLDTQWNYRNIISPFYRLYLIEDGKGRLFNTELSLPLEKGFLYLVPSYTLCNYSCDNYLDQYYVHFAEEFPYGDSLFASSRKPFRVAALQGDRENFYRLLAINPHRTLLNSYAPWTYEKKSITASFSAYNNPEDLARDMESQGIIMQLLARFLAPAVFQSSDSIISSVALKAMNHIITHLDGDLQVSSLAKMASLNADYFSRVFQKHTGWSVMSYIQQKRVERAQFLILTTTMSLEEISERTGFRDIGYFNRVFKKVTGTTPGVYRKTNRVQ